jgi:type VI secretion system protein ImpK
MIRNRQIKWLFIQTGLYSTMIIVVLGMLALFLPSILPAPKVSLPAPIAAIVLPEPKPSQIERIRAALASEIKGGTMSVEPFGNWIAIRIGNVAAFASGEARVLPEFMTVARRIADVIQAEKGPVRIVGYTDDQAVRRNGSFRDNQTLSIARAEAVAALIRPALTQDDRLVVGGRGSDEPITDNTTAEGRARNRRVEILITREP